MPSVVTASEWDAPAASCVTPESPATVWRTDLIVVTARDLSAPGHDRATGCKGHRVIETRHNRSDSGQSGYLNRAGSVTVRTDAQLAIPAVAPGPDGSVREQCDGERVTG